MSKSYSSTVVERRNFRTPRPASACLEAFRSQKLRYAEGLKRHFVDDHALSDSGNTKSGDTASKKRQVTSSFNLGKRRFEATNTEDSHPNAERENCPVSSRKSKKSSPQQSEAFASVVKLEKHSLSRNVPYRCPLCSQTFQSMTIIKAHVNSVHV